VMSETCWANNKKLSQNIRKCTFSWNK
jgi:hypothetical protein